MEISDDNDNFPVFERHVYRLTIGENANVGQLVGTVHATDLDIGNNGIVYYQFTHADIGSLILCNLYFVQNLYHKNRTA